MTMAKTRPRCTLASYSPRGSVGGGIRAFYHKVTTGCSTCKLRRVKSGEERPSCHRCMKGGRECSYPKRQSKAICSILPEKMRSSISVPPVSKSPSKHPSPVSTSQKDQQAVPNSPETGEPSPPHSVSRIVPGPHKDDGYESASDISDTDSVDSTILDFHYIQDRRYHSEAYGGDYWAPNDEREQQRIELSHYLWHLVSDRELFHAPAFQPHKVLDLGTGTGIWSMDFAEKYASAQVTGTDITLMQPSYVPSNLCFMIDDFNSHTYGENKWDFVHARELMGSVKDWVRFANVMFKAIKPGGWIELAEHSIHFQDITGKLDPVLADWTQTMIDSGERTGMDFDICGKIEGYVKSAGFVNVQIFRVPVPVGCWPDDPKQEQLGRLNQRRIVDGLESYCLQPMIETLGMGIDQVYVNMSTIRTSLLNNERKVSQDFVTVIGQKPSDL